MAEPIIVEANGASIPAIGFGTFKLTGPDCQQAVEWAIEAGYRHIDTAAMYGNEEEVGAGIRASGLGRDQLFVTTKVWRDDIAPGDLERSAEASLKRLGLDRLDLLLIHWPNDAVPLADSTAALCRTRSGGLTRHVGVSNYPSALLRDAVRLASEPIVANQVEFHPFLAQDAVRAACRENGIALTAYSPLRSGATAGDAVAAIASRYGKTPSQVVLRWHVQQPGTVAIPKSGNRDRMRENLDVFDFSLTESEMRAISALARPDGRLVSPAFAPEWDREGDSTAIGR